jgi:hypothetical protein
MNLIITRFVSVLACFAGLSLYAPEKPKAPDNFPLTMAQARLDLTEAPPKNGLFMLVQKMKYGAASLPAQVHTTPLSPSQKGNNTSPKN